MGWWIPLIPPGHETVYIKMDSDLGCQTVDHSVFFEVILLQNLKLHTWWNVKGKYLTTTKEGNNKKIDRNSTLVLCFMQERTHRPNLEIYS